MQQRKLGRNGPSVSAIGLGCWSFAGSYGPTNEAQSHDTLRAALDLGVNFLDTANVYGMGISETTIGRFIKNNGNRFVIATKCGIRRDPKTGMREFDNSAVHIRQELEASLKRLHLDQIDLYYIHRRQPEVPVEEVVGTLAELQDEGKIGGFGFSEIAPSTLRRANAVVPVMAVQSEYSLWTRTPELGMIQACKQLGAAFIPFSPLCRGMLAATPPDPKHFSQGDFRDQNPRFMEPNFSTNIGYFNEFRRLAADLGTTPIALGLAWQLARFDHAIPIPGTRSRTHLEECVRAVDLKLDQPALDRIKQILPVGFAHGERYKATQWPGVEQYC